MKRLMSLLSTVAVFFIFISFGGVDTNASAADRIAVTTENIVATWSGNYSVLGRNFQSMQIFTSPATFSFTLDGSVLKGTFSTPMIPDPVAVSDLRITGGELSFVVSGPRFKRVFKLHLVTPNVLEGTIVSNGYDGEVRLERAPTKLSADAPK